MITYLRNFRKNILKLVEIFMSCSTILFKLIGEVNLVQVGRQTHWELRKGITSSKRLQPTQIKRINEIKPDSGEGANPIR